MLLILDSHPVQYRAPLYQKLQHLVPNSFRVVYASDCSVRGHHDAGFGCQVAWDSPLLDGYPFEVLNCEKGIPLRGFNSLTGNGLAHLFDRQKPTAVLFTQFLYRYDFVGLWHARKRRARIWMRQETQDDAFIRSLWKKTFRSMLYRALYRQVDLAFNIGEKNRRHLLQHGLSPSKVIRSPYVTVNSLEKVSAIEKERRRNNLRDRMNVSSEEIALGFFGKLIPKKDPALLIQAVASLSKTLRTRIKLLFVGSGELKERLESLAKSNGLDSQCSFVGFVNQSQLADYYLASDIVMLPSRRMGETWGLVVNEALQAGCRVVVSNAVGCYPEFQHLEGFRVISEGSAHEAARAIEELASMPREFDWAQETMENYTIEVAAKAIADQIRSVEHSGRC